MKSRYRAPKLEVYGNVEQITHATRDSLNTDFVIIAGNPISVTDGDGNPVGGSSNLFGA